jgi:DNA (cytosine-5)-methyltransferase 1
MAKIINKLTLKYIDLFCGIGGFRIAAENAFKKYNIKGQCVFSSDIDPFAAQSYAANFGEKPSGDINDTPSEDIPDHDLLFAGFPCQPFSIIGNGKGFDDARGTLFFEIARILEIKRPMAFILENVKRLTVHDNGKTFLSILEILRKLGYSVHYKVLNALHYGLPQKRERVIIVGFYKPFSFEWPAHKAKYKSLTEILEDNVPDSYYASPTIQKKRLKSHKPSYYPAIWHENKSGNISSYPYSCALRAGASYNYLLVNGTRRLTPREMLRIQGFPDSFKIMVSEAQLRKQAGNAVPVDMINAVIESLLPTVIKEKKTISIKPKNIKKYSLQK